MMSPEQNLAAAVEAATRAVPGVVRIFRTGTIVSKLVDAGARLVGVRDGDAPLVRLEQTPEGTRVEIAIGVDASAGAVEAVHRVHDALDALLAEHDIRPEEIRVTVVHVDETAPSKGTQ